MNQIQKNEDRNNHHGHTTSRPRPSEVRSVQWCCVFLCSFYSVVFFFLILIVQKTNKRRRKETSEKKQKKKETTTTTTRHRDHARPKCAVCSGVVSFFSFPFCTPHNIYNKNNAIRCKRNNIHYFLFCFVSFMKRQEVKRDVEESEDLRLIRLRLWCHVRYV